MSIVARPERSEVFKTLIFISNFAQKGSFSSERDVEPMRRRRPRQVLRDSSILKMVGATNCQMTVPRLTVQLL